MFSTKDPWKNIENKQSAYTLEKIKYTLWVYFFFNLMKI